MRWQARLRRVHDPMDMISSTFQEDIVRALYSGIEGINFPSSVQSKFTPVLDKLKKSNMRLVQIQASPEFDTQRDQLARDLGTWVGGKNARSAASYVRDIVSKGAPELVH